MAYKQITAMDIYEIISRWHSGYNITQIATALSLDRKTVREYIRRATSVGLAQSQPLPAKPELLKRLADVVSTKQHKRPVRDVFLPYQDEIIALVTTKPDAVKAKTAYEIICERYEVRASYSSFKRFVRQLPQLKTATTTTCRFETEPGEELQIDYGKMGRLYDPIARRNRDVYAFIGTLSYSRLKFVEFVYKQDQRSFVGSHLRMFEFFQGVPKRLVIDNLKAGVLKADIYLPELNRTYQEMADHYGAFIDPARPNHPKDKGKVERAVPIVREQFRKLKALHPTLDISKANRLIRIWSMEDNGMKVHGTTGVKPYEAFTDIEKATLKPLPVHHFEMATWKQALVHVDQYVQFEKGFYSVSEHYVGHEVWIRGTEKLIEIYEDHTLIKKCLRVTRGRYTDPNDFPKNVQLMMQDKHTQSLLERGARIGSDFKDLIRQVLQPHAKLNTRRALALLRLREKYQAAELNEAAKVAVKLKLHAPKQLEALINKMQSQYTDEPISISEETAELIRPANYFIKP